MRQDQNFTRESELAELPDVRSQPSCHPTSSSNHSTHHNSSHHQTRNSREKSQWDLKLSLRGFTIVQACGTFGTFGFSFGFLLAFLLFPLTSLWDHDFHCLPLPDDCLPRNLPHLEKPSRGFDDSFGRKRIDLVNIHGLVRHDFQACTVEQSHAIRVEYQVFLEFFKHQCLQTSELDLIV